VLEKLTGVLIFAARVENGTGIGICTETATVDSCIPVVGFNAAEGTGMAWISVETLGIVSAATSAVGFCSETLGAAEGLESRKVLPPKERHPGFSVKAFCGG
jgi:hypothetical protein